MIFLREIARIIHPYPESQRHILVFSIHCDLSYDGNPQGNVKGKPHVPITYVFAGFFSEASVWERIECRWTAINKAYGVRRFHAAHLNRKTHEYAGWSDATKISYSREMLAVINEQGSKMYAVSCGMLADDYRSVISVEGRRKMGSPYLACFNSCIALVAKMMDGFPENDRIAVLIDPDDGYLEAIASFYKMKGNPRFQYRSRLATCTPVFMEEVVCMQTADLVAYEVFKRLHGTRSSLTAIRSPLQSLMTHNIVSERYFSALSLNKLKEQIESTPAGDGELVIIPAA